MAKRKGAKKALTRSSKKKTAPKKIKTKKAGPRSQPLPGMEQVRDRVLDNACETIAEGRNEMAAGRAKEQEGTGIALQRLAKKPGDQRQYRHAGVELVFVPGMDKLRVRLSKAAELTAGGADEPGEQDEDLSPSDHPDAEEGGE